MRILLTGATGYIGKQLLPALLDQGHEVICCVRNKKRIGGLEKFDNIEFWEVDFLKDFDLDKAPKHIDVAYYLIHSMSSSISNFPDMEKNTAQNFRNYIDQTEAQQIIYLTGMLNDNNLSEHLKSRKAVEKELNKSKAPVTILRAGIAVGPGSASFEIIRDLVEKLPIMLTPKWLNTLCQPIGINDVVQFLTRSLLVEETYGKEFDIGGKDILSYKEMLMQYAEIRGLKRKIFSIPILGLNISSYWLYFVTPIPYKLAYNLVESMRIEMVAQDNRLAEILHITPSGYKEAVEDSFQRIESNTVISSWKDSFVSSSANDQFMNYAEAPKFGCVNETQEIPIDTNSKKVLDNIWSVGGKRGWYYANFLWKIRGFVDKLLGGIGLRRGRTHPKNIYNGDALDFWRVIVADKLNKRLLLYSEMKLPGEAWLEFKIAEKNGKEVLQQTATFRPHGLLGRLYWYAMFLPHLFIFSNMAKNIVRY
jgi:uncharacterized protein YbjT (DUF2867 family)